MLDLAGGESMVVAEGTRTLVCTADQSRIGDAAVTVQLDLNISCEGLTLSAANSEQSTVKDDRQAPGWPKRYIDANIY